MPQRRNLSQPRESEAAASPWVTEPNSNGRSPNRGEIMNPVRAANEFRAICNGHNSILPRWGVQTIRCVTLTQGDAPRRCRSRLPWAEISRPLRGLLRPGVCRVSQSHHDGRHGHNERRLPLQSSCPSCRCGSKLVRLAHSDRLR